MKFFKFILMLGICFICMPLSRAQNGKKADDYFEKFAYAEAIGDYEKLILEGYNDPEIFKNLGDAHFFNSDYTNASKWYRGLYMSSDGKLNAEYLHRYALTLKTINRFDESHQIMAKIKDTAASDIRLQKFLEHPNYLKEIEKLSDRSVIEELSINSEYSEFAPSFYNEGISYTSSRPLNKKRRQKIHAWTQMPFLDIHYVKNPKKNSSKGSRLEGMLNSDVHESSATFSKDGKIVFFTRNNVKSGEFIRDSLGVSRLKIFKATLVNGAWQNIEDLPFNSDNYSTANPCLTSDGKRLYFASDMPESFGKSDIFYVDILEDGSYSKAIHLGDNINTEGRETFPFLSENEILYFASDGHPGLGGLDIFAAKKNKDGSYKTKNLGLPINGPLDDFGLIFNIKTNTGFFSSNREGGKGNDDIYMFEELIPIDFKCTITISGRVVDKSTKRPIPIASFYVYGSNGNIIDQIYPDENGKFEFDAYCDEKSISFSVTKDNYLQFRKELKFSSDEPVKNMKLELTPQNTRVSVTSDLGNLLGLGRIKFYKGNNLITNDSSSEINKLVDYLKDHKDVKIKIRQHTDSRGNAFSNTVLARKRGESIKRLLIDSGIKQNRISVLGVGEAEILNNCIEGVECSESEHEINNRTEFVVVE